MNLTDDQKQQLNKLVDYKKDILDTINTIQDILKIHFPDEYSKAIQFYIPQIVTALEEREKWLSRGEYSLQDTIDRLSERCNSKEDTAAIYKYI